MSDVQVERITKQLQEYFDPSEVSCKPLTVSGNRALAAFYLDARAVQDRLDEVFGPDGWQTEYAVLPGGSVVCTLKTRWPGGVWISKSDVGSPSDQPDEGDRMKAAFSDATKRAAVQYGVGRYLYHLGRTWLDWDAQRKRFVKEPELPEWARPQPKPVSGEQAKELEKLLHETDSNAEAFLGRLAQKTNTKPVPATVGDIPGMLFDEALQLLRLKKAALAQKAAEEKLKQPRGGKQPVAVGDGAEA